MPGLWKQHAKLIYFHLVVDDFGLKYLGKENAKHLKQFVEQYYEVSTKTKQAYPTINLCGN